MNKNKHLISKYLEGELDALTAARFENDLTMDPVLREEMDLYKKVDEALADSEVMDLRMQLEKLHNEVTPEKQKSSKSRFRRMTYVSIAASLVLVLGFSAFYTVWNGSNQNLVEKFYRPYDLTSTNRSGSTDTDRTLQTAMEFYQSQQYREAVVLFEKALEKDPNQMSTQLYSGISYFEIAEFIKAAKSFSKVIEHNDNLYIEQSKWYLGLCYLKTEEKEMAILQFTEIAKSDSYYSEKAKKILKKLR